MNNLSNYFYNNQEIALVAPHKKYKGYVNKIEDGFLYIILYASFENGRVSEFSENGYDMEGDISKLTYPNDYTLIIFELSHTYLYKASLKDVIKNTNSISIKIQILNEPVERNGREFLRINTLIQFIYEEISIEKFFEIKEGYISRPSFTTSVYEIYNIAAPRTYRPSIESESEAAINPQLERLLIAINSKLDVILSFLNPESSIFAGVKEKSVSVSGSGIMWKGDDKELKQGSIITISMLFPVIPQFIIRALAQVVKIYRNDENSNENTTIVCKFIAINESDRDEIIKFTLEKQRQLIKKSVF